jgi:hypothetical protein
VSWRPFRLSYAADAPVITVVFVVSVTGFISERIGHSFVAVHGSVIVVTGGRTGVFINAPAIFSSNC